MTTIAIFNQKGGVGKTTTALNLSAALARRDISPLLFDLDPQAQLTSMLGIEPASSNESIFEFYNNVRTLGQLKRTLANGAEIVPGHAELVKVDYLFGKGPNILNRLKQGIEEELSATPQRPVLIDCCPLLGVLSLNAIFAADTVLIPVSSDYLGFKSAIKLEKNLKSLEQVVKKRIDRVYLVTRFDMRRKLSLEILRQMFEKFGVDVCDTRIRESVSLAESPMHNKDIFAYKKSSRGARDYANLLDELLTKNKF